MSTPVSASLLLPLEDTHPFTTNAARDDTAVLRWLSASAFFTFSQVSSRELSYCLQLLPFRILFITFMFHFVTEVYESIPRETEDCL